MQQPVIVRQRGAWALATALWLAVPQPGSAQVASDIAADGTLGTTISQGGNTFSITGGTQAGGVNLFHSFARFTVGTGDVADFQTAPGIARIIGRVTGGDVSVIDGTLSSSTAGASLYLVNPAGLLFGPNAIVSVDGGFHASTADFLRFDDGATFFVDPASASSLSVASVASFGFLSDSPADIEVYTPTVQDPANPRVGTPGLATAGGATLSLVGGDIVLGAPDGSAPAYLFSPLGQVRVASVAAAGEAVLGSGANVDVEGFARLGTLRMQGNALIDARQVVLRAGRIEIADATVLPGGFSVFGLGPPPDGGSVDISARESLAISGSALDPVFAAPYGVLVFAGLDASAPFAAVPDVRLTAPAMSFSGSSGVTANRFLAGPVGLVALEAEQLTLSGGAAVSIVNAYEGDGGVLRVRAEEIVLDGADASGFTGFAAQGVFNPGYLVASVDPALTFASSGDIDLATRTLEMRGGAEITTDSRSFGPSGDIAIAAQDVRLDGARILAQSSLAGNSGNVTIDATGRVELSGGSVISAATLGGGDGGSVRITAGAAIDISGEASGIASQTTPLPQAEQDAFAALVLGAGSFDDLVVALGLAPGADMFDVLTAMNALGLSAVPASELLPGAGGAIELITPTLSITGTNAAIDSSTAWDGDAGDVIIRANDVSIGPGATIGSRTGIPDLVTRELFVGSGNAGNVMVVARGDVVVGGAGATVSTDTRGTGDAGDVSLSAHRLRVVDQARISSSSSGTGLAGNIAIALGDSLRIDGAAIATEAIVSDGGNVSITAPRLVELRNGEVTTSVGSGFGNGGNIFIDPDFVVLQNSRIIANAFGGAGGNIDIIAGFLIVSPDSVISASSALGVDGIVRTTAPDSDVSAALAVLPASYLDAAARLQAACGAARVGRSSLTEIGRGGVVADPGGYLISAPLPASSAQALYTNPRADAAGTSLLACAL